MFKKIDHLVITTAQMNACIAFYETLGFQVEKDNECTILYAGDFKINVHLKGHERMPHATNIQTGSGDFCLEICGSLDAFYQELKDKGIHMETKIVSRYGVKGAMQSFYIRDPDGTLVEICSYE